MKYASEDLLNEHEGVLFGLKILEKMVNMLIKKNGGDLPDLINIVDFFKLFADKCHHGKEEGLLFPEMEKYGIQKEGGPIGQMLLEHTEGRKYIAKMTEACNNKTLKADIFIESAGAYIQLMRSHIEKENNILFPMGDGKIPEDVQQHLLESFEKHEEEVMGAGTHEKLHALLHALEKKYLS